MKNNTRQKLNISRQDSEVLLYLLRHVYENQRSLASETGLSLGAVNGCLQRLAESGFLNRELRPTPLAQELAECSRPRSAVILAAGPGMRMVPINYSLPKALLEVRGERLIERVIRQLHEVGITEISVVVGFMKESFEYLIDAFGVDLVVNPNYASRNNSYSLRLALDRLHNSYIVPSDLYCEKNPFRRFELYSWYMVSEEDNESASVRVNRKRELVRVQQGGTGNRMIGISYLLETDIAVLREKLLALCSGRNAEDAFWEEALFEQDHMIIPARLVDGSGITEINTFEELRELDANSSNLRSDAIETIAGALHCREGDVEEIRTLKKGMTNRSFLFSVRGKYYIMRIPGEGTDQMIDRKQEAATFSAISGRGLCEDPIYLSPENGYKITAFLDGARVCDPADDRDVRQCMALLRRFHAMRLEVPHFFDLFAMIDYYESLRRGSPSVYSDYEATKEKVFSLRRIIERTPKEFCLTHIDAVPDNFLFCRDADGRETLQLIDWEYAGMQDPHVDIAMFCIYSLYSKGRCDELIDLYFEGRCSRELRCKIYCYIAVCGLLWSNWCELKRALGVEFGEYSLRQYRYAKDFYRYATALLPAEQEEGWA